MQELSFIAPQQPRNAMINTIPPIIINTTGALHKSSPVIQQNSVELF